MNDCLWRLEGVCVNGRARSRLEVDFLEIGAGITAVVGPSGAGKTTLLDLLVGFARPDRGRVVFSDSRPGRLPFYWVPAGGGLWPHLTAREHLRLAAGNNAPLVERLLEGFELADKSNDRPDQFSEGERARLAVARALAAQALVLIMDEPLAHVDVAGGLRFWNVLRREVEQLEQASLVFSTHMPEIALGQATRVICLESGRMAYAGGIEELYREPPDSRSAWYLGPANWFEPAESAGWFSPPAQRGGCIRPEQLAVVPREDGPLIVERARCAGSLCQIELREARSGKRRTVYQRPAKTGWRGGERVWLQILCLLLGCLALLGCSASSAAPVLKARAVDAWMLPPEDIRVPAPRAVHWSGTELFCLDNAGRVLVYDQAGKLARQWWMPEYSVGRPEKIWQLKDGRLIVADTHYHRVIFFDESGNELARMGGFGKEPGQFIFPVAVVQDASGFIYVCEYGENDRVQKFTSSGQFVLQFGGVGTAPGQFQRPSGIAWHKGLLYVVDAFNNRIQVFDEDGAFVKVLPGEDEPGSLYYPYDIAVGPDETLYVVEYGNGCVSKFDLAGRLLGRFGTSGQGDGQFQTPWGLSVDSAGAVYVADTGNRRIVKLTF